MLADLALFFGLAFSLSGAWMCIYGITAVIMKETRSKSGRNEQRKLTATALNNLSIALFIAGLVTPFLSLDAAHPASALTALRAFPIFLVAAALHILARKLLSHLED